MTAHLLGLCVCGEPIFRHRVGRRQISCEDVRRLDQALKTSCAPTQQTFRAGDQIHRDGDTRGAEAIR